MPHAHAQGQGHLNLAQGFCVAQGERDLDTFSTILSEPSVSIDSPYSARLKSSAFLNLLTHLSQRL